MWDGVISPRCLRLVDFRDLPHFLCRHAGDDSGWGDAAGDEVPENAGIQSPKSRKKHHPLASCIHTHAQMMNNEDTAPGAAAGQVRTVDTV